MDGTGQKAFLVHAGLCLMSTLGSVPPPPAPAPPQLWDSIYLLLCSGHIHLQGSCLLLLLKPRPVAALSGMDSGERSLQATLVVLAATQGSTHPWLLPRWWWW